MFSRAVLLFGVSALAVLAAAIPNPDKRWGAPSTTSTVSTTVAAPTSTAASSQCNTGPIQCCESVQSASSPASSTLLGLLGIVLSDLDVSVGLNCSAISVIGVGSGVTCSADPVCCEDNSHEGLISIGCVPVTV